MSGNGLGGIGDCGDKSSFCHRWLFARTGEVLVGYAYVREALWTFRIALDLSKMRQLVRWRTLLGW